MTKIGFVGLGSMGAPIAGRLLDLQTSSQVYGTNRSKEKAAALVARGLRWRDTPREVAETADFGFSMVTDDAALDAITSGTDGLPGGLAPGGVLRGHEHSEPGRQPRAGRPGTRRGGDSPRRAGVRQRPCGGGGY